MNFGAKSSTSYSQKVCRRNNLLQKGFEIFCNGKFMAKNSSHADWAKEKGTVHWPVTTNRGEWRMDGQNNRSWIFSITPRKNHWDFGLWLSSEILNTRKHNVSKTGPISFLRWGEGDTYSVGFLEGANFEVEVEATLRLTVGQSVSQYV
jgi:hypothetical protein